jgi:exonuclease III
MTAPKIEILCWNIRGLNRPARRDAVHELLAATLCHVACLQETKLNIIDQFTASYLGGHRLNNFAYKPAGGLSGTRVGILLLWNDNYVELRDIIIQEFHISATVIS